MPNKKIATTSKTSYTIKKLSGKKLAKNTFYKVKVVALDASGNKMATSKVMHAATGGYNGNYGNATKIAAKKSETAVSVGDTTAVGVKTYKIYKNKKTPATHAAKVRYLSSNRGYVLLDTLQFLFCLIRIKAISQETFKIRDNAFSFAIILRIHIGIPCRNARTFFWQKNTWFVY